jgi:hypothetical protein
MLQPIEPNEHHCHYCNYQGSAQLPKLFFSRHIGSKLLAMSSLTYMSSVDTSGLPYDFSTSRNSDSLDIHAIEQELMVQQQIQSQYLSPIKDERRSSNSSCSPFNGSKLDGSLSHQAEDQPCLPVAQIIPQVCPPRPVNMVRSASHHSTKSGEQQGHSRHCACFMPDAVANAINMSRSSTQHSNISTNIQGRLTAPRLDFTGYTSSSSEQHPTTLATDMLYNTMPDTVNTAYSMYPLDLAELGDDHATRLTEADDISEPIRHASSKSEMFGQGPNCDE